MRTKGSYFSIMIIFLMGSLTLSAKPAEAYGWNYISRDKNVTKGSSLVLLPEYSGRERLQTKVDASSPEICLELLYTMPFPEDSASTSEMHEMLLQAMTNLESLSGLKYYSSRNKDMTLYLKECFPVPEEGSRKKIKELPAMDAQGNMSLVLYQKDVSFGANWYDVQLEQDTDYIHLSLTNINTVKYLFIPAMHTGGLSIDMCAVIREDKFLFYIVCQMEQEEVHVLTKKVYLPGFFDHRISAYQGWIARQLYKNPEPGEL